MGRSSSLSDLTSYFTYHEIICRFQFAVAPQLCKFMKPLSQKGRWALPKCPTMRVEYAKLCDPNGRMMVSCSPSTLPLGTWSFISRRCQWWGERISASLQPCLRLLIVRSTVLSVRRVNQRKSLSLRLKHSRIWSFWDKFISQRSFIGYQIII